jgi:UDP-N-acetylmuramate--alanine ligase
MVRSPAADITRTSSSVTSAYADVGRRSNERTIANVRVRLVRFNFGSRRHNLQNALAAVAVGVGRTSFEQIARGLREFRGAERRFEVRGEPGGILVVDDYGHHPTEIAAVLAAAATLGRRKVVAFQPHRYTRTAALMDAFGPALAGADAVVLTDIYPAGEPPIPGVTVDALAERVRRDVLAPVTVTPRLEDVPGVLAGLARPGDVVITLGAGSIGTVPDKLIALLERKGAQ